MIDKVAGSIPAVPAEQPASGPSKAFDKVLKTAGPAAPGRPQAAPIKPHPPQVTTGAPAQASAPARIQVSQPASKAASVEPSQRPSANAMVQQVAQAQHRLDKILKMAESGKTFSPAELLAFQAHAYRASQEIDLASKVVEKGTAAVKQTLQTQV